MTSFTEDENIRKILRNIIKEEKTHFGEFQTLLLRLDEDQDKEMDEGEKEVDELIGDEK